MLDDFDRLASKIGRTILISHHPEELWGQTMVSWGSLLFSSTSPRSTASCPFQIHAKCQGQAASASTSSLNPRCLNSTPPHITSNMKGSRFKLHPGMRSHHPTWCFSLNLSWPQRKVGWIRSMWDLNPSPGRNTGGSWLFNFFVECSFLLLHFVIPCPRRFCHISVVLWTTSRIVLFIRHISEIVISQPYLQSLKPVCKFL